ncbi:hypothetical protein GW916_13465 [bacterium]|nr:hypothetical protein [bacterium]
MNDEIVYLGGSTISLYITEPQHIKIRETFDVDCIVEVAHREEYETFSKKLRRLGFSEDIDGQVTCRFKKGELILDAMPTDERILGFSNSWYKEGFKKSVKYDLDGIEINIFDLPYLVATKIEAFNARGKGQYSYSHDIEDIVTLIDGCHDFAEQLAAAGPRIKEHLAKQLSALIKEKSFLDSIEAHISDRMNMRGRKKIIIDRIFMFLEA